MEGFRGVPERLGVNAVPFMTEYFDLMSHHIHAHGGTITKFVVDAVVAFWNTPEHAANACRAAVACQRVLQKTIHVGGNPLKARIGINSGTVVVGTVGPSTLRSFTIMGETLNVAAALERACMRYGTKIIIGEETWRLASKQIHVRELDGLLVQGHSAELQIYKLLGFVGDEWERPNWLPLYEAGLEAYRARNFSAANDSFRTLLTIKESDKPSQVMLERCSLLLKAQPKANNDATVATKTPRRHLTLPDKPSIAVLPFANLSSDPEQEYLVDGIVDDIITELSRFSELFVIARNSSFRYKGKATDVRQVGRELGVRYVLEGSIRRGGDRIRISAQLIDAVTGAHRWAGSTTAILRASLPSRTRLCARSSPSSLRMLKKPKLNGRAPSHPPGGKLTIIICRRMTHTRLTCHRSVSKIFMSRAVFCTSRLPSTQTTLAPMLYWRIHTRLASPANRTATFSIPAL
jgi:TolB-like protein